jgi:hypothetical protein
MDGRKTIISRTEYVVHLLVIVTALLPAVHLEEATVVAGLLGPGEGLGADAHVGQILRHLVQVLLMGDDPSARKKSESDADYRRSW